MPIIPKLNLKAAVRINDAPALNPAEPDHGPPPDSGLKEAATESIVAESHSRNVNYGPSDDEQSPGVHDFDYDEDGDGNFKSPPPCLLDPHQQMELSEDDSSPPPHLLNEPSNSITPEITSNVADIVHHDNVSLQSFSDADSTSEHSIQSDTSYTKEAMQIVNTNKLNLHNFTALRDSESLSNTAPVVPPPRKRRRAVNKLSQDPTSLPLCDLLFYNPPPTIFQSKAQEDLGSSKQADNSKKALTEAKKRRSSRSSSVASEASAKSKNDVNDIDDDFVKSGDENSEKDISIGGGGGGDEPILTIDESGNIVIKNPSMLNDPKDKKPEAKMKSSTTYNSFRRRERSKNIWNTEETGIFYTALEIVGTDFTLMEAVFFKDRGRSRKQLKQKFKREEKINRDCIDSILYKSLRNRSKLNEHLLKAAADGGDEQVVCNDGPVVAASADVVKDNALLQNV